MYQVEQSAQILRLSKDFLASKLYDKTFIWRVHTEIKKWSRLHANERKYL